MLMRFPAPLPLILLVLAVASLFAACDNTTVGPVVGNGSTLEVTVDGKTLSYNINSDPADPTYTTGTSRVFFGGTLVGDTTKTVTVFFTFNIDGGTYPTTVNGPDVNMVYILKSGSDIQTYSCDVTAGDVCSVTATAGNGTILDGTFSGTLSKQGAPTQKITISNGKFSVTLRRI